MSTTIRNVMDGGELNILRGVVCSTTGTITYMKGQKQEHMLKFSLRDETGFVTVLVFNERLFGLIKEAAIGTKYVKIERYRRAETPNTLIIGATATCSLLAHKVNLFTDEEIEEARLTIYAKIVKLAQAKISPHKTRVSVKGRITKVYERTSTCKKVLLQDVVDQSESMVTIWQPQHNIEAEVGQTMALYDARASHYSGGSIDTSTGTLIEVSQLDVSPETKRGTLVGFGIRGEEEVVEIVLQGEQDEMSFQASEAVLARLRGSSLPGEYILTIGNGNKITNAEAVQEEESVQAGDEEEHIEAVEDEEESA